MSQFQSGDQVLVDGTTPARIEKNVGGEDYIVRMGGERRAIAGFRMRSAEQPQGAGMGPGGMPLHSAKTAPVEEVAPPAPAPAP